jgi:hypothetical protein
LQDNNATWLEELPDCAKEGSVSAPILVVVAQLAGRGVEKVRWVADDEIEALAGRYALQIVRMVDGHTSGQSVVADRPAACGDRLDIDVGEAQHLAQAVAEQREADKARTGAPLESARLLGHAPRGQQRCVVLTERGPAAVEVLLVMHPDPRQCYLAPRPEPPQQRLDVLVLQSLPDVSHDPRTQRVHDRVPAARAWW